MEFRLLYEGPLKANRGAVEKQFIRRQIHSRLRELVARPPMQPFRRLVESKHKRATLHQLAQFTFVPIVAESLRHTAELHITLLVPEEPGRAITQSGDLDNRLKTLLDGLRMPKVGGEVPKGDSPGDGESPFYCLLEDDCLVSSLSVDRAEVCAGLLLANAVAAFVGENVPGFSGGGESNCLNQAPLEVAFVTHQRFGAPSGQARLLVATEALHTAGY